MSDDRNRYQLDSSSYQRPNAKWDCGRAAEGLPCPKGPGGSGECGAVCTPYLEGERYYCGSASALGGKCESGPLPDGSCCQVPALCKPAKQAGQWICRRGMCEDGPLPDGTCCRPFGSCQPTRSIFARRKQVTATVFALAVASLLAMVGGPDSMRKRATSPGKLTSHHNHIEEQCSKCHAVGGGTPQDWIQTAFTPTQENHQSALCLKCHSELGSDAMLTHSLPSEQLAQITDQVLTEGHTGNEPLLLHVARIGRPSITDKLACATCHHEHHGEDFNLVRMTDLQCQVCHANAFHSFVDGHPEFVDFPYDRRTRLYFDHAAHFGQHFPDFDRSHPDGVLPHDCTDCHETGPEQKLMMVSGFERSCASCHDHQIHSNGREELAFFALPAIDVRTLREQGFGEIGQWPVTYPEHVQASGTLSPLTQLFLENHPDFASAVKKVEGLDLSDLHDASPSELKSVHEFVWALKNALVLLRREGRQHFQLRLATLLKKRDAEIDLIGSVFYDKILEAQSRWLPNLDADLAAHGTPLSKEQQTKQNADGWNVPRNIMTKLLESNRTRIEQTAVGWYLRDADLTLRYRLLGHIDPWLTAWIEAWATESGSSGESESSPSSARQRALAEFADPAAPGRCMKCHTADRLPEGGLQVHWRAKEVASRGKEFTDFTHRPHLAEEEQQCQVCHKLQASAESETERGIFRAEFIHPDGTLNTQGSQLCGDFAAIQKTDCAQCHSTGLASQSCLTCHNYHIGTHVRQPAADE